MNKYEQGDFGYLWTVVRGKPDIEGQVYYGNINCSYSGLTSLKGSPTKINGYFDCSNNELTSIEFCPKQINGEFDCSGNNLTSLKGCPTIIKDEFYCYANKIKDINEFKNIKFCEDIDSDFDNDEIMNLISENSPEYYI